VKVAGRIHRESVLACRESQSYCKLAPNGFPNTHPEQGWILSLPMFAEITLEQQDEGIDLVLKF
jgi:hypothetical protein